MSDKDAVLAAYADLVKKLSSIYLDAQMLAPDDAAKKEVDNKFKKGLAAARTARDRALGLVGVPA